MRKLCCILLIFATAIGAVMGLSSGGRVLCTGSDNHVAIEARHTVCPTVTDSSSPGMGDEHAEETAKVAGPAKSCVDYELPSGTLDRTQHVRAVDVQYVLMPFLMPAPVATVDLVPEAQGWTDRSCDDPLGRTISALRCVILLI